MYLIIYVDDIVIIASDKEGIIHLKQYLAQQLQTKNLGHLRYFIGIEVAHSSFFGHRHFRRNRDFKC